MQTLTYAASWQVRFVIGSGGATIKSIRQETSTFIKSDRNEADPSAPVVFRIEGHSAEGIEAARVRIQEIVGMYACCGFWLLWQQCAWKELALRQAWNAGVVSPLGDLAKSTPQSSVGGSISPLSARTQSTCIHPPSDPVL